MTFKPDWDKSGTKIKGNYLGLVPYVGIIEKTRVKYGGNLEYQVALMDLITVFGDWRSTILIDNVKDQNNFELLIDNDD